MRTKRSRNTGAIHAAGGMTFRYAVNGSSANPSSSHSHLRFLVSGFMTPAPPMRPGQAGLINDDAVQGLDQDLHLPGVGCPGTGVVGSAEPAQPPP